MKRDHVWYIKYTSAIVILIAMVFHVNGWTPWNSFLQLVGACGWMYAGSLDSGRDRTSID